MASAPEVVNFTELKVEFTNSLILIIQNDLKEHEERLKNEFGILQPQWT